MRTKIKPYQGHIIPKSQPTLQCPQHTESTIVHVIDITIWLFNIAIEHPL